MKLILIRHAETDMAGTFCGHSDPPVNAAGHNQIAKLIANLQQEKIDAVFSSDLQRALTTATSLANYHGTNPVTFPELREICFGDWEGLTWQQIEARDPNYARRWTDAYPNLPAPAGEAFPSFESRVTATITKLMNQTNHDQAAVVTHAGVMRVVLQTMCGIEESQAWELTKPYCCYFKLPYEVSQ
jgi:broad specificity phosphatase PhoE